MRQLVTNGVIIVCRSGLCANRGLFGCDSSRLQSVRAAGAKTSRAQPIIHLFRIIETGGNPLACDIRCPCIPQRRAAMTFKN